MTLIAVIPARMGSERLPRKNLLEIEPGLSLVQQAVDCARHAGVFDHVIVSSDEDIPVTGAELVRQPPELSGPDSDITSAVAWVLAGRTYDFAATLQPAVIARSPLIVRRLVTAVTDFRHMGPQPRGGLTMAATHRWLWQVDGSRAWNDWHGLAYPRSQASNPRLVEINAVQVAHREVIEQRQRWGTPLVILELPAWAAALDIDTPEEMAEARALWPWAKPRLETCTGVISCIDQVIRCA